ncbi:hypothetical protein BC938DRAFT_480914 [Jimgerdemannia flammicorona]|uniref:Uncharacterized protein n=1 Tax=Jimgerdemannia flammicorona TaxID=994334 RepID=A0A433QHD5_9FUNG|nr:hypothetical protein BC938DRAFT_480914 [Jimgerdemannia flammicorona]
MTSKETGSMKKSSSAAPPQPASLMFSSFIPRPPRTRIVHHHLMPIDFDAAMHADHPIRDIVILFLISMFNAIRIAMFPIHPNEMLMPMSLRPTRPRARPPAPAVLLLVDHEPLVLQGGRGKKIQRRDHVHISKWVTRRCGCSCGGRGGHGGLMVVLLVVVVV